MKRTKIIILLREGLQHELTIHEFLMAQWPGPLSQLLSIAQLLFQRCWRKLAGLCVFADRRENSDVITGVVERQWITGEVNTNS